jgi:hypothetical protein
MNRSLSALALLAGLSLCSLANASTVWNFSGTSLEANGYAPTPGTIGAYAFQLDGNGNIVSTPVKDGGSSTLSGLFQVDNTIQDEGAGIAPYNPSEGGTPGAHGNGFPSQDGITDDVPNVNSNYHNGPYGNFLELQLSASIPAGTTLTFLMQLGTADGPTATVDVYTKNGTVGSGVAPDTMNLLSGSPFTIAGHNNTVGQFSFTTDGQAEVVAIVADCHYLLLDTITGTTSSVPEPRFYGVLLAGLLGLVGMFVQKRKRVTA